LALHKRLGSSQISLRSLPVDAPLSTDYRDGYKFNALASKLARRTVEKRLVLSLRTAQFSLAYANKGTGENTTSSEDSSSKMVKAAREELPEEEQKRERERERMKWRLKATTFRIGDDQNYMR
jgi:hypothetical protein